MGFGFDSTLLIKQEPSHGPCPLQLIIFTALLKCSRCRKETSDGWIKMKSAKLTGLVLIQIINWGILLSVHCIILLKSESTRRISPFALKTKLLHILCCHLTKKNLQSIYGKSNYSKKNLKRRSWIEKKCELNSNDLKLKFYLNIDSSLAPWRCNV